MKFDDLDARMRAFEIARDPHALPEVFLVARIDGRSFTRLTKELMNYRRPFDERFRDAMIGAVERLMTAGFQVVFGYTQSDEISLLFDPAEASFGRNIRKWTSILAGEASAALTHNIGRPAAFDCRVIELPRRSVVIDYFRWRNEDAHRNALNGWCYWKLREEGCGAAAAAAALEGMSVAEKNELLFQRGVQFNELPAWQRRGVGLAWEEYDKPAMNRKTGEPVTARRRRLQTILELPMRDEFSSFIEGLLADHGDSAGVNRADIRPANNT
ncbi:MAG TPA: tRNA(His) guanylyltransferase Thg1 family protein [Terriglobia bacterium]|nr:tRNA(His) guanylyltransferase Thg1 family protein [Terriglobia bacterium]